MLKKSIKNRLNSIPKGVDLILWKYVHIHHFKDVLIQFTDKTKYMRHCIDDTERIHEEKGILKCSNSSARS